METVFTEGSPEDRLALLEALYAQAPVGLAFLDRGLRYRRVNAAMAAINGRPAQAHIGRTLAEVLGDVAAPLEAEVERVLATGEAVTDIPVVGETAAAPGRLRHWSVSLHPVSDADGRLRGVGGIVLETTREHDSAAEAEAAHTVLDGVFQMAPVGLALWDPSLRYLRINEAGARLNALPVSAHLGRPVQEVLRGAIGERVASILGEVLRTRRPQLGVHLSGERPGIPGEVHHREASYYPVLGPDGTVAAVAGVGQDVGPRRRMEELRRQVLEREHEARLAAEAARRRAELLAMAGRAMAASLDFDETVRTIVRVVVPAVADACTLHLIDAAGRVSLASAEPDPDPAPPGDEVAADVVAGGHARSTASAIVVPVIARGRGLGALTLRVNGSGRTYGEDDVLVAEALADRAALALENARLHGDRTRIARTLQRSLLPPDVPVVPGVDVAAGYLPAGDENDVGGDFYDVFESEPGNWTVVVGDVAGKGAEAAALTSLARYTLRTASMLDTSPAHNLRLLNEALLSRSAGTCTVLYARLRPGEGRAELTAAAAGHPPPLVRRADGTLEELTQPGTLLGAVESPFLQTSQVELRAGDLVLLYTDGATDVRVDGGILGDALLRRELAACGGCGAQETVDRVAGAVRDAQHGRLGDDLALLALRVRA